jgi:hypothetical protein
VFCVFAGFKRDSPGFLGNPRGCPRHLEFLYQPKKPGTFRQRFFVKCIMSIAFRTSRISQ